MGRATYQGRSQAIHVGSSGTAAQKFGSHGFRLSTVGTQVIADGASATVDFSSSIADTDDYWRDALSTKVTIPSDLGGVYMFAADGFVPGYSSGLKLEVVVESGDGEDPAADPPIFGIDSAAIHTSPPKSINAMAGSYRLCGGAVVHLKVTNNTGGSVTLSKGSFSGFLMIQLNCPSDDLCLPAIIQSAYNTDAGGSFLYFHSDVTVGSLVTYCVFADPGVTSVPNGWDPIMAQTVVPFTIHLGGPAQMRAYHKIITLLDLTDPVSHVVDRKKVFNLPTWSVASGFASAAWESDGDPDTVSVKFAVGSSTLLHADAPSGKIGMSFGAAIGFPVMTGSSVAGWVEGGATGGEWGGHVTGAPPAFDLTLGALDEWGAITVGYLGRDCS